MHNVACTLRLRENAAATLLIRVRPKHYALVFARSFPAMKASYVLAAILASVAATCHASSVRWFLSGVTFSDGATARGWFDEDADTGSIGRFVIYTSDGPSITGREYRDGESFAARVLLNADTVQTNRFQRPDTWQMRFTPVVELTNGGGTLDLDIAGSPNGNIECNNCGSFRGVTSGQLVGVTDLLFGSGFDD